MRFVLLLWSTYKNRTVTADELTASHKNRAVTAVELTASPRTEQ
jgi:hypothetical protein